jgi:peptidylprolyl isomerase
MNRNKYIAVFAGLIVVILFFVVLGDGLSFGTGKQAVTGGEVLSDLNVAESGPGVTVQDLVVGEGKKAVEGKVLTVHYTGALEDGTIFDSSTQRDTPFSFTLGAGEVIQGWDEGLVGMKVGGQRLLVIPPELGYGDQEVGSIPASSTLIFQVELLDVKDAEQGISVE